MELLSFPVVSLPDVRFASLPCDVWPSQRMRRPDGRGSYETQPRYGSSKMRRRCCWMCVKQRPWRESGWDGWDFSGHDQTIKSRSSILKHLRFRWSVLSTGFPYPKNYEISSHWWFWRSFKRTQSQTPQVTAGSHDSLGTQMERMQM